jgi:hypothetical protein
MRGEALKVQTLAAEFVGLYDSSLRPEPLTTQLSHANKAEKQEIEACMAFT